MLPHYSVLLFLLLTLGKIYDDDDDDDVRKRLLENNRATSIIQ